MTSIDTMDVNAMDAEAALARSACYGLIAHGFRYPDAEWRSIFEEADRWTDWPDQLKAMKPDVYAALIELRSAIGMVRQKSAMMTLQEQFSALFGHAVRGACPAYQLEYGRSEVIQRASDLADISGFYAAFGMDLSGTINERADHVSVETEFMSVLCAKEATARAAADRERIDIARKAQRGFLESHLGRWLPAFLRRVGEAATCDYYQRLGEFAGAFIAAECAALGVSAGSTYLELRPSDQEQESTQSCGIPGDCGADEGQSLTQLNVAIPARNGGTP